MKKERGMGERFARIPNHGSMVKYHIICEITNEHGQVLERTDDVYKFHDLDTATKERLDFDDVLIIDTMTDGFSSEAGENFYKFHRTSLNCKHHEPTEWCGGPNTLLYCHKKRKRINMETCAIYCIDFEAITELVPCPKCGYEAHMKCGRWNSKKIGYEGTFQCLRCECEFLVH